jgi:hypothetical protein
MNNNNKIFILCCPRSNSTCITRVLEKALRYKIIHEPYASLHDKINYPELTNQWYKPNCFNCSKQIVDLINSHNNVIVKDMVYSVNTFIDDILYTDAKYILLFRDELSTIISLLNKCDDNFNTRDLVDIVGFDTMLSIYDKLINSVPETNVLVVNSNCLLTCLKKIFKFVDIEFNSDAITIGRVDNLADYSNSWHESKIDSLFEHWHGDALNSDSIFLKKKVYTINDFNNEAYKQYYLSNANVFNTSYMNLLKISELRQ